MKNVKLMAIFAVAISFNIMVLSYDGALEMFIYRKKTEITELTEKNTMSLIFSVEPSSCLELLKAYTAALDSMNRNENLTWHNATSTMTYFDQQIITNCPQSK